MTLSAKLPEFQMANLNDACSSELPARAERSRPDRHNLRRKTFQIRRTSSTTRRAGKSQKDGVCHVEVFPLQLLLTKAAPHLESPSFSTAISTARSFAILLHTLLYTLQPEIMYAQSALGLVVLAGSATAKLCMNMTVPVNILARTGVFNIAVPQTNLDAITFVQNNTQQGRNFTEVALLDYATTSGTYNISTQFCMPSANNTTNSTVQVLTHGIGFDKTYETPGPLLAWILLKFESDTGTVHTTTSTTAMWMSRPIPTNTALSHMTAWALETHRMASLSMRSNLSWRSQPWLN